MPLRKKTPSIEARKFAVPWPLIKKILPFLLIALLFGGFIVVVREYPHLIGISTQPVSLLDTTDYTELIKEVSEIFELPDEEPTVATVTDPALLADQPFFAKSQTGDIALVYNNARKAILYRPSLKKVIEVGVLSDTEQSSTPAPTPTSDEPASVPSEGPTPVPSVTDTPEQAVGQ